MRRDSGRPLRQEVGLWLKDSEDCFRVARQNYKLGNYHVAAFYVHSAVERALKAAVVAFKFKAPPKTHSLTSLYSEIRDRLPLSQKQMDFLAELTPASQTSRYIDVSMTLPRDIYTRRLAKYYLSSAKPILGALRRRVLET